MIENNLISGTTIIDHDSMGEKIIEKCDKESCFTISISYKAPMDQMISLIQTSDECYQEIHFSCYLSKISNIASWTDQHGQRQTYFTGSVRFR
jgi:hypothetical protein